MPTGWQYQTNNRRRMRCYISLRFNLLFESIEKVVIQIKRPTTLQIHVFICPLIGS